MEINDTARKGRELCGIVEALEDLQANDLKELELLNTLSGTTAYECVGRA